MQQNRQPWKQKLRNSLGNGLGIGLLLIPILGYGLPHFLRPDRTPETRSLFPGIDYRREVRSLPRPIVIHIVTLDLTALGVRPFVTPGKTTDITETNARTTSEFLQEFQLKLAINANFFYPFREETPWDYFPHSGDRVNNVGQAISDGQPYSAAEPEWAVACFSAQRVQILDSTCPAGTTQAVSGNEILIRAGRPVDRAKPSEQVAKADAQKSYARTAIAIDATGRKAWLILVDGKQRLYSEGMTIAELTQLVQGLGADTALNLDGGGSVTLAVATPTGPKLLNSPTQNKIPLNERPIANHLGFYAQ
jgi:Phosphodiester glycosidase